MTASAGPPPTVDSQDPLPESNFFWRRWFAWVFTIAPLGLLVYIVRLLGQYPASIDALHEIALWLIGLAGTLATYYMIAPSAEQIVKIVKTAGMFSRGVIARTTTRAESPDGRVAETRTTVNAGPTTPAAPVDSPPGKPDGTEVLE